MTTERQLLPEVSLECRWQGGCGLLGLVKLFNAELSPMRFWRGSRYQEVGEEKDYIAT